MPALRVQQDERLSEAALHCEPSSPLEYGNIAHWRSSIQRANIRCQMLRLSAIRADGFALAPVADTDTPTVKLSGNADSEVAESLDRFLQDLHRNLLEDHSSAVEVDLVELYFMNSACIRALASWVHAVKLADTPYRVYLQINPRQSWQQRSLEPIKRLAPGVVVLLSNEQANVKR